MVQKPLAFEALKKTLLRHPSLLTKAISRTNAHDSNIRVFERIGLANIPCFLSVVAQQLVTV